MDNKRSFMTYALAAIGFVIGYVLSLWFLGLLFVEGITMPLFGPSIVAVLAAIGLGVASGLMRSTSIKIANAGLPARFACWGAMCVTSRTTGAAWYALAAFALAAGLYATGIAAGLMIRRHGRRPSSVGDPPGPS